MSLPRVMGKIWSYSTCVYLSRGGSRGGSRALASLSGSRYVSNPVDDDENSSVISDLLVYERRKQLKKNTKIRESIVERKPRKTYNDKKTIGIDLDQDDSQNEITKLMKAVKSKKSCYIVGQDAADTLVKHVKKDLCKGDVIIEANLGAGVLTSALLEQTSHKVVGFEPNPEFFRYLGLQYENASRFELQSLDLFKFYWYYTLNKREPEREGDVDVDKLAHLLAPMQPVRGDQEESPVKIVASVCDTSFFHKLSLSFTFQCCFYQDVFPVFYIYVPEKTYVGLTSSKSLRYRKLRLPFVYYFNIEHLDTAPKSSFFSPHLKRLKHTKDEEERLCLVKLTPKINVHEIIPKQELEHFHYFLRCLNNTRAGDSLIFQLEKWIPGCGIDYIKNGFRMFMHPKQLTEEQLLEAYRLFRSLPSFRECMFHHLCENWTIQFGLKDDIPIKPEAEILSDKEGELTEEEDVEDIPVVVDDEFRDIIGDRSWVDRRV